MASRSTLGRHRAPRYTWERQRPPSSHSISSDSEGFRRFLILSWPSLSLPGTIPSSKMRCRGWGTQYCWSYACRWGICLSDCELDVQQRVACILILIARRRLFKCLCDIHHAPRYWWRFTHLRLSRHTSLRIQSYFSCDRVTLLARSLESGNSVLPARLDLENGHTACLLEAWGSCVCQP